MVLLDDLQVVQNGQRDADQNIQTGHAVYQPANDAANKGEEADDSAYQTDNQVQNQVHHDFNQQGLDVLRVERKGKLRFNLIHNRNSFNLFFTAES